MAEQRIIHHENKPRSGKIYQKLASQYHQHINNILHMCMAALHMCSKTTIPIATQKDFSYMNIY